MRLIARLLGLVFSSGRLFAAVMLVWLMAHSWAAGRALDGLAALPDYDYVAEAASLRAQQRYAEAILVLDSGMQTLPVTRQPELRAELIRVEDERDSFLRRAGDVGQGALTGEGATPEALAGAVAADLFVFGNLRDLGIQGEHWLTGQSTDPVIVALSAVGLALTLAPEADGGVSIMKLARRLGAMTDAFAADLLRLARAALETRSATVLERAADDTATLAESARTAGAMTILRNIDDTGTLARAAGFSTVPGGGFALWVGGRDAVEVLRATDAGDDVLLLRAARKGPAGVALLRGQLSWLLRPSPLIGLMKSFYKGNLPRLFAGLFNGGFAPLFGIACAWLAFELVWLALRLAAPWRRRRGRLLRESKEG